MIFFLEVLSTVLFVSVAFLGASLVTPLHADASQVEIHEGGAVVLLARGLLRPDVRVRFTAGLAYATGTDLCRAAAGAARDAGDPPPSASATAKITAVAPVRVA